jgi:hypothetical protein
LKVIDDDVEIVLGLAQYEDKIVQVISNGFIQNRYSWLNFGILPFAKFREQIQGDQVLGELAIEVSNHLRIRVSWVIYLDGKSWFVGWRKW